MSKIIEGLNKNQKLAVQHSGKPLRLIAGAGSGKTKVLTHKIAYIIEKLKVKPSNILAVTFTNKAAKEMKDRVAGIIGAEKADQATISTYHSLCVKILRSDIDALGLPKSFNIIDTIDQKQILRPIYSKLNVSSSVMPLSHMINYISSAKSDLIEPKILIKQAVSEGEKYQALIYKEYNKVLIKNKSLDFDDLLIYVYKIFKDHAAVLKKWQNKYTHLLVDEFQDTSWIQYEIIKMLNKTKNLTIVGDPDQTIYTWRGAKVELIINFDKDFKDATTINLEENYRSTKEILKSANSLIEYNRNRLKKELFTNNESGNAVEFFHGYSPEAEAKWVVKKINELKKQKIRLNDIAIFYRSNYLSKTIEQALIASNIPYTIFGDVKFYERQEVKDALAFLKVINDGDDISLQRIINIPARKIGKTSLEKLNAEAHKQKKKLFQYIVDHFDDLPISPAQRTSLGNLFNLFGKYKAALNNNSISKVMDKFLIEVGYFDSLNNFNEQSKKTNLQEFIRSITLWEKQNPKKGIGKYLEEVALFSAQDEVHASNSFVTMMTIHTAKGLEFKNVFVIGMSEGVFPSPKAIATGDSAIEEERRLAYVAITRAKERLFITDSKGYSIDHRTMKVPSRFLREMGLKLKTFTKNISIPTSFKTNYEQSDRNFKIGDLIEHKVFGEGTVISKKNDTITIGFKEPHGEKTLMKNHKSLQRVA